MAAAAAAAAAAATPTRDTPKDGRGDPPGAGQPPALGKPDDDGDDDAARAATAAAAAPVEATCDPNTTSPCSSSDLDFDEAAAAIRQAELSRVPLPRDHVAARRRPILSPTDLSGADWCQLRSAFRLAAPHLADGGREDETAEMRRGKEAHLAREEEAPPGLKLSEAVALGLRGPDARVTVRPQTRADRVALRALESAAALAELLQYGRAREVWVFGRVQAAPAGAAADAAGAGASSSSSSSPHPKTYQWLTGVVDQVERRPKGFVAREAAESAAAARGEKGRADRGAAAAAEPPAERTQRRHGRRTGGGGGDEAAAAAEEEQQEEEEEEEEEETLVTELKTRGGGASAPSEAALRGAAMQAMLYRRLLSGLADEAAAEARALLVPPPRGAGAARPASPGAAPPRPGGFLEAQGVADGLEPLSPDVAALVAECERAVAALVAPPNEVPLLLLLPAASPARSRAGTNDRRRSSSSLQAVAAAVERPASPIGSQPRRLRPRLSSSSPAAASPPAPPPPPPPPVRRTVADALLALSRLAAAALPPAADHVRVEFVGQGEEEDDQDRLLYGAWVGAARGAPAGRALARRAARHLAFLRGARPPTRRSGEPGRDPSCRWCAFRGRCAELDGVLEEDDAPEGGEELF